MLTPLAILLALFGLRFLPHPGPWSAAAFSGAVLLAGSFNVQTEVFRIEAALTAVALAGGLALIGAVVAEFVAGTAGQNTGLASRILESSFRNEIPRMFAALLLVSMLGIVIFLITNWLSKLVLSHWHESEIKREI